MMARIVAAVSSLPFSFAIPACFRRCFLQYQASFLEVIIPLVPNFQMDLNLHQRDLKGVLKILVTGRLLQITPVFTSAQLVFN
jgi:hypothetical protein